MSNIIEPGTVVWFHNKRYKVLQEEDWMKEGMSSGKIETELVLCLSLDDMNMLPRFIAIKDLEIR